MDEFMLAPELTLLKQVRYLLDTPTKSCPELLQPGDSLDPSFRLQRQGRMHYWPQTLVRQTPGWGLARLQASCMGALPVKGRLRAGLSRHTDTLSAAHWPMMACLPHHGSKQSLGTSQDACETSSHSLWGSKPSVRDLGHRSTTAHSTTALPQSQAGQGPCTGPAHLSM